MADANGLNKRIGKASDVVGMACDSLMVLTERKMLTKLRMIFDSISHPLHDVQVRHKRTFSERLIPPKCMTERHRKIFLPVAI